MQRGTTSLPPRVQGPPKGQMAITLSDLEWAGPALPPHLVARIAWWGDAANAAEEVPLRPGASAGVAFTLRSGPAHLARYLTDLGVLEIPLVDAAARPPKAVARVAVDAAAVAAAGLDAPWAAALPATCPRTGAALGTLGVRVDVMYVPLPGQEAPGEAPPAAQMASLSLGGGGREQTAAAQPAGSAVSFDAAPCAVLTPPGEPPLPAAGTAPPPAPVASPAASAAQETSGRPPPAPSHHTVAVRVESAFQLPPPPAGAPGGRQHLYASAVWQRDRTCRVHTHLAAAHDVPAAGGHAAVWRCELEVGVDAAAFAEAAAGAGGGVLDGPLLLINVWRSGAPPPDPAAALDAALAGAAPPAAPTPFDRLVGCAALDLTGLLSQAEVAGRFPLVNPQHQEQGCVKASVRPGAALAAALDALGRSLSELTQPIAAAMEEEITTDPAAQPHHTRAYALFERPGRGGAAVAVQQYAWSDSGSDEGGGMDVVGVSFVGAVSCDEEEEEEGEDAGGGAGDPRPKLISDDWMFDISKAVGGTDGGEESCEIRVEAMEVSFSDVCGGERGAQQEQRRERTAVAFKNRLLPGVVTVGPDGIAPLEFAPFSGAAAPAAAAVPPLAPHAASASPPAAAFHHPSLDEGWLFGIGSQQQQGRSFGEPAPAAVAVTATQFAPMGGGEGGEKG